MKSFFYVLIIVLITVFMFSFSCSLTGQNGNSYDTNQIVQANNFVVIGSNSFNPETLKILINTTVYWTNTDTNVHNVFRNGLFSSGNILPGSSFSFEFKDVGTYGYADTIYGMIGTIVVTY